jgi:hypothetical protein
MVLEQFKYPGCPVYTLSLLVSYVVTSKGTWHKVLIPQVLKVQKFKSTANNLIG